jgi:hypothetical protein
MGQGPCENVTTSLIFPCEMRLRPFEKVPSSPIFSHRRLFVSFSFQLPEVGGRSLGGNKLPEQSTFALRRATLILRILSAGGAQAEAAASKRPRLRSAPTKCKDERTELRGDVAGPGAVGLLQDFAGHGEPLSIVGPPSIPLPGLRGIPSPRRCRRDP